MYPRRRAWYGNAITDLVVRQRPRSRAHAERLPITRHRLGSVLGRVDHAADAEYERPHQWDTGQDDGDAWLQSTPYDCLHDCVGRISEVPGTETGERS